MGRYLLLLLVMWSGKCACDTGLHHRISDPAGANIVFTDSVRFFIDSKLEYSLEEVRALSDSDYVALDKKDLEQGPLVLWTRIQLLNDQPRAYEGFFELSRYIDTVRMYTYQEGRLLGMTTAGNDFAPFDKPLAGRANLLPFLLRPGATGTYYFQIVYGSRRCNRRCMSAIRVTPRASQVRKAMQFTALQMLYAGIMLFLSLVSLLMYLLFRERVFVWFTLLLASFVAYFMVLRDVTALLFNHHRDPFEEGDMSLIIATILLFSSLFVSGYLELRTRFPRLNLGYLLYTLGLGTFPFVAIGAGVAWKEALTITDRLLLLWLLLTLGIIVYCFDRRDKSSRILLTAVLTLIAGAATYIISAHGLIPLSTLTNMAFQIGTIFFASILLYGMFSKIIAVRAEKQRFEELDQVKSRFFANISHEFRTPLTLIMGPIKDILERTKAPADRSLLQTAHQNADRLLQLVNQLLDLSKLEANKMKLKAAEHDFPVMLKGIVMSFESLARRRHIHFNFVTEKESLPLYVDQDKIEKIFYNLLSNAFKFTEEGDEIAVILVDRKDRVEVLVRDTGAGIPAARLANIFNRFFQGETSGPATREGSGIGLALVKELVQLHWGNIQVESEGGVGTTFTVSLPKGSTHLDAEEIDLTLDATPAASYPSIDLTGAKSPVSPLLTGEVYGEEITSEDTPLVLVIEDNAAVRTYIRQHLVTSFRVVEANDGREGVEQALELLPDLIISDVMMPHRDGYEICEILKTDERTSHIPIILLTAKAASEEKLKGLTVGADDYLFKPFDTKELEVRVRNLIASRTLLRKKFSSSETIVPQADGLSAVDRAFLEKVFACVEDHLADEQFGVEVLAREVGLSRSQLNRKLKALTDQTPNKLIQSLRLQKAKELLEAGTGNVSEIALQTGFNSTAYFVKCFREKYGRTPGDLL